MALLPSPKNRACKFSRTRLKHFKRPLVGTRYSKLLRLYDSPLQTTHVAIGSLPVNGAPVNSLTPPSRQQREGALLQVPDEFLFVASSSKSLVPKHRAEVSTIARAVMSSTQS
jgi:hypothetical protein